MLKEMSSWSVIGNWHGGLFYLGVVFYYTGFMMFYLLLVETFESKVTKEITTSERGMIIFVQSFANGVCRMVSAFTAHYFNINPQILASTALLGNAAVLTAFAFSTNYYVLLVLVVLFGMFNAPYSAFTAPTTIRLFGTEASGQTLGILYVCVGLGCIPGAPLAGFIFENLGSYRFAELGSALCYLLVAICNLCSHAIHRKVKC